MFDATITADLVLVSTGVKETNIKRFPVISIFGFPLFRIHRPDASDANAVVVLYFREEYLVDVFFRIVLIMAIAGNATQHHTLIFIVPFVNRQH